MLVTDPPRSQSLLISVSAAGIITVSPLQNKSLTLCPASVFKAPVSPAPPCCASHADADAALGDVRPLLVGVGQRALGAALGGQPEAVDVGEEVAGSPRALALHEGLGFELRQAAARRHQREAATLITAT